MIRRFARVSVWALLAAVVIAGAAAAQTVQTKVDATEGKLEAAEMIEFRVTVEKVDLATREVTIRHDDGVVETVVVGDKVTRLDEVKPNDDVVIQVYRSLTLALDKLAGDAPAMEAAEAEMRTDPAELPGGIQTRQVTLVARVTAVDADASTVTLVGPKGRSVTLDVEPETLAKVEVGDAVTAVYTEAVAVSIARVTVE